MDRKTDTLNLRVTPELKDLLRLASIVRSEESPTFIAREILGLSKMNWNNTQFDGKYPVTLGCARKVGEIMKYLGDADAPQIRYGFYM